MYRSSGQYSPEADVPYLDAVTLMDDSDGNLNLIITNRNPRKALDAHIVLHDFDPSKAVRVQTVTGEGCVSQNQWDKPDEVKLRESDLKMDGAELSYSVPAHSIVLLSFDRKEG